MHTNYFKKIRHMMLFPTLLGTILLNAQNQSGELPTRDKIDVKYTWNLTDVYASDELWEADFKWVDERVSNYKKYEGTLHQSAERLLELIKFDDEMSIKMSRMYLYAMLSKDLDLSNSANLARHDRISQLYSKASTASSFIRPEILSIPKEKIDAFIKSSKELAVYQHQFNNLFRLQEHTLPKEQEQLLAMAGEISRVPNNTYSVFKNAEMPLPKIKDPDGKEIELSAGRYGAIMYSTNREYRERAFKEHLNSYKKFGNTFASLLNGSTKTHIFYSRARKFSSAQEAALNENNIPVSVYDNLIKTVNENLAPLHRWARLRKKALGVSELHPYDAYVTLFPASQKKYTYDESVEMVRKSLEPLGKDYINNLDKAFNNRWIDVYETKGKRGGAYSSGTTFGVHPYVLLNWNDQLNDVFTLAHEMGHNMHSYYTGENQPYPYADYSIFIAEVASTTNEALLLDYLIDNAKTKEEKLPLLEHYLTNITTTFYRQTMFAEFEKVIHQKMEEGQALSAEDLSAIFKEIVQKYWGPDMVVDDEEAWSWSRIPHFYYNFYVYQYATSYAASQELLMQIKNEKQPAIDRYLAFLKAGSSDYPINVLKKAGVDVNSPDPVLNTIKKMNWLLDEMERLMN